MNNYLANPHQAAEAFYHARRRARFEMFMDKLSRKRLGALSYGDILQNYQGSELPGRSLQSIEVDNIVGSTARYQDFTRSFLPTSDADLERWRNVHMLATGSVGFPPIEVYQVGDYYFVNDGNHRVSVARYLGIKQLEAYVTVISTRIPFDPSHTPETLILQTERLQFESAIALQTVIDDDSFYLTAAGHYPLMQEHIQVHQQVLNEASEKAIALPEAAKSWYQQIYLPIKTLLERYGLLNSFPERTPLDLYVWLSKYRTKIQKESGWWIEEQGLIETLIAEPELLADEPEAKPLADKKNNLLAASLSSPQAVIQRIQVVITSWSQQWSSLEQALILAQQQQAEILGLMVVLTEKDIDGVEAQQLRERFLASCHAAGVAAQVSIKSDNPIFLIREYEVWSNLLVIHPKSLSRRHSGFLANSRIRSLIQHSRVPVLICADKAKPLCHAQIAVSSDVKSDTSLLLAAALHHIHAFKSVQLDFIDKQGEQYVKVLQRLAPWFNIAGLPVSLNQSKQQKVDLYISSAYSLSYWQRNFFHDRFHEILYEQHIPFLAVK